MSLYTGIDILFEASIPEAAHDPSTRDPPPRCFPGTRQEYIEDITNWVLPAVAHTASPIYWMRGPGVGKSAVAQTCAENLRQQRRLGAAFFFSINRRSRTNGSRGEHVEFFRSLIDKTMESQFQELIVKPLRELEKSGMGIGERIAVFVDALDECENREAQCQIIEIVGAAARDGIVPLCWAFFSRPEPHIEVFSFSPFALRPCSRSRATPMETLSFISASVLRTFFGASLSPWIPPGPLTAT